MDISPRPQHENNENGENTPAPKPDIADTQPIPPVEMQQLVSEREAITAQGNPLDVFYDATVPARQTAPSHPNRKKWTVLSVVAALGLGGALFAAKAFGGDSERTPIATETSTSPVPPTPTETTPETSETTEPTPATSSTSPTNIPTQTETKSVPVAIPTTAATPQSETKTTTTPTPSETSPTASETAKIPEEVFIKPPTKDPYVGLHLDGKKQQSLIESFMISADTNKTPTDAFFAYYNTLAEWLATGTDQPIDTMLINTTDEKGSFGSPIWAKVVDAEYSPLYIEALTCKDADNLTSEDAGFKPDVLREGYRQALELNADTRYRTQDEHTNGYGIHYGYLIHSVKVEELAGDRYLFKYSFAPVQYDESNVLPDDVMKSIAKSNTQDGTIVLQKDTAKNGKDYWFVSR